MKNISIKENLPKEMYKALRYYNGAASEHNSMTGELVKSLLSNKIAFNVRAFREIINKGRYHETGYH